MLGTVTVITLHYARPNYHPKLFLNLLFSIFFQYIFCVILILMGELALGVHFLYFYDSMGKDLENTKLITTLTSSYGIDPTFTQSVDFAQHRVCKKMMKLLLFLFMEHVLEKKKKFWRNIFSLKLKNNVIDGMA